MKSLLTVIVVVCSAFAAEAPVRELTTQAVPFARSTVPWFRHGYLITHPPAGENGATISSIHYGFWAWRPDGSFAYQTNIEIPDGTQPVVRDLDFNADGAATVAASAFGGQAGIRAGLLFLDRTGQLTRFVDTGRFMPAHLAIAPDGSIWTLGWQNGSEDYMIVHRFQPDGSESNAYLPRSSFGNGLAPGGPGFGPQIVAANDRIGIWVFVGNTSQSREWVEMDRNGNVRFRIRTDDQVPDGSFAAMTGDGRVFLSGSRGELYELNRVAGIWKAVWRQGPILLGADGNSLVFRKPGSGIAPITLDWFDAP